MSVYVVIMWLSSCLVNVDIISIDVSLPGSCWLNSNSRVSTFKPRFSPILQMSFVLFPDFLSYCFFLSCIYFPVSHNHIFYFCLCVCGLAWVGGGFLFVVA